MLSEQQQAALVNHGLLATVQLWLLLYSNTLPLSATLTAAQCLCRYLPGVTLATLAEAHYHHAYPIDLSERRVQHIALHLLQVGLVDHVSICDKAEDSWLCIWTRFSHSHVTGVELHDGQIHMCHAVTVGLCCVGRPEHAAASRLARLLHLLLSWGWGGWCTAHCSTPSLLNAGCQTHTGAAHVVCKIRRPWVFHCGQNFCSWVQALRSIHALGVAHKDIAPKNIQFSPAFHLLDFGVSELCAEGEQHLPCKSIGTEPDQTNFAEPVSSCSWHSKVAAFLVNISGRLLCCANEQLSLAGAEAEGQTKAALQQVMSTTKGSPEQKSSCSSAALCVASAPCSRVPSCCCSSEAARCDVVLVLALFHEP